MQIETYEIEEHTTEGRDAFEVEAEAQALIESLGLEGQQELLRASADPDVTTKTRIPYRRMTAEEVRVYGVLYPEHATVTAYDVAPIPLRVLQVSAHGRELFDQLEVWGPVTEDPDPILVGIIKKGHREEHHLLARWGDALLPFQELYEKAEAAITKRWKAKAEEVAAECMAFMDAPSACVHRYLAGEWVHEPWI